MLVTSECSLIHTATTPRPQADLALPPVQGRLDVVLLQQAIRVSGRLSNTAHSHTSSLLLALSYSLFLITQASTVQMALLMQFNESISLTTEQLAASTGLPAEVLQSNIELLLKTKLLGKDGAGLQLQTGYKYKKTVVKIDMPIKAEQKQADDRTRVEVEEDRTMLMQVCPHCPCSCV